jgi:hypothetical protein
MGESVSAGAYVLGQGPSLTDLREIASACSTAPFSNGTSEQFVARSDP